MNNHSDEASSGPPWLTTSQAAAVLQVSERTVQRRAAKGELEARKVVTDDGEKWEVRVGDDIGAARVTTGVPPGGATSDDRGADTFHAQNEGGAAKTEGGGARVTTGDDTVAPLVTTEVPPGGVTSQKDELEAVRAELLEQLKGENQFLRAALEQRDRDAAELRAALRKALEIVPRQLPIGDTTENARQAATSPMEAAKDAAETGDGAAQAPQKVTEEAARKEPRPLWKVILGVR